SPDGSHVRIPSKKDNLGRGLVRDGEALNTTNTVRTIVSYIDLQGGAEVLDSRIDLDDHSLARAVAFGPRGSVYFVATQGSNQIDVFDAYNNRRLGGVSTGLAPSGLAVTDGRLLV